MDKYVRFRAIYHDVGDTNPNFTDCSQFTGYLTYHEIEQAMYDYIQFKGMTINYGWFIYGETKDGKLEKIVIS